MEYGIYSIVDFNLSLKLSDPDHILKLCNIERLFASTCFKKGFGNIEQCKYLHFILVLIKSVVDNAIQASGRMLFEDVLKPGNPRKVKL